MNEEYYLENECREINSIVSSNDIYDVDYCEALHSSVDKRQYYNLEERFSIIQKKGNFVELGCLNCNKIIKVKYDVCTKKDFECPSCKLYSLLEQEVEYVYEYGEDEFFSQKMKIVLLCNKCGGKFVTNPARLRHGIHCTRCNEIERERKNRVQIVTSSTHVCLSKETKKIMVGINKKMNFSLSYTNLHTDIIKCEWGENEGMKVPLYITPIKQGTAIIKIELEDNSAEKIIFVDVGNNIDVQSDNIGEEYTSFDYKNKLLKVDVNVFPKENGLSDIEVKPYILCTQIDDEEKDEPYAMSVCYLFDEKGETVCKQLIGAEIRQENEIWTDYVRFINIKEGKYHVVVHG